MTELQAQIEAIFHADYVRETEVLGDVPPIGRTGCISSPYLCGAGDPRLGAKQERHEAEDASLRADVAVLREALAIRSDAKETPLT